jgi:hypothetical protein
MLGFESIYLFLSFQEHRKSSVWKFLEIILYANQVHSSGSNGNGDFNDFWHTIVLKLVAIIADPLTIQSEQVGILFAIGKIIILVGIKTRRAIFATSTIRKRSSFRQSFVIPTSIRPETRNVPKIDQFRSFLIGIEVFYKFHSVELRISIKMTVD